MIVIMSRSMQATLNRVYDLYKDQRDGQGKPSVKLYPFNATSAAQHWYGATFAVESVLLPKQADHATLLSGECKAKTCEKLWWPESRPGA
jgi:hypothetical protein